MARPVAVLAALVLLAGTVAVRVHLLDPDDQPGPLVREALASLDGRAVRTELGIPKVYFGGVEDDLAALCIGKR